jgi:hypothetical protein
MQGAVPLKMSAAWRFRILKAWAEERPRAGAEEYAWYERVSEESGHTVAQIRRVVADEAGAYYAQVREGVRTHIETIAEYVGATQARAMAVIAEAMDAEEISVVRDGHGNPILDTNGQPLTVARRLWPVQLKAAETLLGVLGIGPAAQGARSSVNLQFNTINGDMSVRAEVTANGHMPESEVHERYHAFRREVEERLLSLAPPGYGQSGSGPAGSHPQGTGRNGGDADRTDGAPVQARHLVLVDPLHKDKG